jgi:hypothetical protein
MMIGGLRYGEITGLRLCAGRLSKISGTGFLRRCANRRSGWIKSSPFNPPASVQY